MNDEMIEMMKRIIRTDLEKNDLSMSERAIEDCILGKNELYSQISEPVPI